MMAMNDHFRSAHQFGDFEARIISGILAQPDPEEHRGSDASPRMAADDGSAKPPSFETPSFAGLLRMRSKGSNR
jgi:hypothetical protein